MNFVLFGAQGIALSAYQAFHYLYPQRVIRCFLVSQPEKNASVLAGIPVVDIASFAEDLPQEEKNQTEVLIATPENVMGDIERTLASYGFHSSVRLTSSRWAELMGYYYVCDKKYMPLSALPIGCHRADIRLFMAKFYKDKPLTGNDVLPPWVVPIQVGASLCRERVADILDCDGENIFAKNVNYSELTALYWMWKNGLEEGGEYFGLSHYRRILELSEDDVRLKSNQVDVVLPYPMPYAPDIEEHHRRYLAEHDWEALLNALKELQPEYAHAFPEILHQQYLYNYNILLARKDVLKAYCAWLFPILERVEELSVPRGWERKDRYIGYMGETLETLYFLYHRDELNIVHTGCRFLT